jgi:hypothetical protein
VSFKSRLSSLEKKGPCGAIAHEDRLTKLRGRQTVGSYMPLTASARQCLVAKAEMLRGETSPGL